MAWLSDPNIIASFFTLVVMETVLGIDNIVFISILSGKLPEIQQRRARLLGMAGAFVVRMILLFSITWVMSLTKDLFNAAEWVGVDAGVWHERFALSGRDLVLLSGGLFLIYKANIEIYESLEGPHEETRIRARTLTQTVLQITILDVVFGLDSVITAVGMADNLGVMIAAVAASMLLMAVASKSVSRFITKHPTIKLLALAFLMLIGVSLVAEGIAMPIPKGFIYFAMAFSMFVEILALRVIKKKK